LNRRLKPSVLDLNKKLLLRLRESNNKRKKPKTSESNSKLRKPKDLPSNLKKTGSSKNYFKSKPW
jgi:hypothetical protein